MAAPSLLLTLALGASVPQAPPQDPVHPTLAERLGAADATQPIEVVFWLRSEFRPRTALAAALSRGATVEDARRAALRAAEAAFEPVTGRFAAALRSAGHAVRREGPTAPLVYAAVPAADVPLWVAREDVWRCFAVDGAGLPEATPAVPNDFASKTARTDAVHRRGIDGSGVKVLVNDPAAMVATHPWLPPITTGSAAPSNSSHPTAVAGVLASTHPQHTGAAPGVDLFEHDQTGDFGAPIAWGWAMQQGVSLGTCAWATIASNGSLAFLDIYFDYITRQFGVLMFKSAGNGGNGNPVTTPGLGYNVMTVGGADDRSNRTWLDDQLAVTSSTGNPLPGQQQKPEIVAPSTTITGPIPTAFRQSGIGPVGSGTSYAAPLVCGVAALLGQTRPALLARPETMRALLMAGAHNLHGTGPLSDYDGAGMVNAAASQDAAARDQFVATSVTAASFAAGPWTHTVSLDQGDATRIAAVWLSNSNQAVDVLEMDLDMVVRDAAGQVVATSASSSNPFELVEFVPATSGAYTVELSMQRFQGTQEPLGLAWASRWNGRTNEVSVRGTPAVGATVALDFRDPYHPFQPYAAVLSLTPYPSVWTLPGDTVLRLGFDFLADASLNVPGFLGLLDFGGNAVAGVPIPNIPALTGLTVYAGMVTMEFGVVRVEDVSPTVPITIQ